MTKAAWRSWLVHGCNQESWAFKRGFARCALQLYSAPLLVRLRGVAKGRCLLFDGPAVATNKHPPPVRPSSRPRDKHESTPRSLFSWSTLASSFNRQITKKSTSLQWTAVATRVPWTLSTRTARQSTLRAPLQKPPISQAVRPAPDAPSRPENMSTDSRFPLQSSSTRPRSPPEETRIPLPQLQQGTRRSSKT